MQNLNNTKQKIVNLLAVLLVFYAVSQPALAAYVVNTDLVEGGSGESIRIYGQIDSVSDCPGYSAYWDTNGYDTLYPAIYDDNHPAYMLVLDQTITLGVPFDFTLTTENLTTGDGARPWPVYNNGPYEVWWAGILGGTTAGWNTDCSAPGLLGSDYDYNHFNLLVPTTGGGGYTPPHFNLVGTTSDFIASVSGSLRDGVQHTGSNIWPMFAFVGVSLAFIIALQLLVFTKRATGVNKSNLDDPGAARGRKNSYKDPMHPDHVAFERGERENLKDGIDLFPDDKK